MSTVQGPTAVVALATTALQESRQSAPLSPDLQSLHTKYKDAGGLSLLSAPGFAPVFSKDAMSPYAESARASSPPSGSEAAVASAGGDPPPPPRGDGSGFKGHYLDAPDLFLPTHVDPALRSEFVDETRQLALVQTIAARDLLYHPGATLRSELGLAAHRLADMITGLLGREDNLVEALGGRLLGAEGLLANGTPADLLNAVNRVAGDIPPNQSVATAHDRAVVLALMGDIGALYADTGATTGVANRSPEQADALRAQLSGRALEIGLSSFEEAMPAVKAAGGSNAVGPAKGAERIRPSPELVARTGIHSLGPQADDVLGIAPGERIPMARWQVAHIGLPRVIQTEEPLAGHMSGSPAEILHVWDLLRNEPPAQQFIGALPGPQTDARYARAAGAAAFLVGLGYHSAVEVAEDTLIYTGQALRPHVEERQDAGHLLGRGAATDLIGELMATQRQ